MTVETALVFERLAEPLGLTGFPILRTGQLRFPAAILGE